MPYTARDFEPFARWYTTRRLRETGRPASISTLRTKTTHLARVCNIPEVGEGVFRGYTLCDRSQVVFLLDRLAAQMSPGAARVVVYALLDWSAFLVAQGLVQPADVALGKPDVPPKNPLPAISVYSPDDMEMFVSAARGVELRWWAFMAYLVDTGRRVGETLSLRYSYLRLDESPAYAELPDTKNGQSQYVPLSMRLVKEVFTAENIEKMRQTPTRHGSAPNVGDYRTQPFPWSYNVARARFGRFCERAGLPDKGFHCFRHTVITERLARGVPIQAVAALAGHKNISTTDQRYNHTNALSYAGFVERSST
jgi:integrase